MSTLKTSSLAWVDWIDKNKMLDLDSTHAKTLLRHVKFFTGLNDVEVAAALGVAIITVRTWRKNDCSRVYKLFLLAFMNPKIMGTVLSQLDKVQALPGECDDEQV